jgi:uncharacterized protein
MNTASVHTQQWIKDVVIAHNFCPFAAKEVLNNSIRYIENDSDVIEENIQLLEQECDYLLNNEKTETTLLIFPNVWQDFHAYLDLVEEANDWIEEHHYGVFQLATFHPEYCFEGEAAEDASNYTNRSPYPMLHILREKSILAVAEKNENFLESIPERNITLALAKGTSYFEELLKNCKR